jgi:hypothetical protein
LPRAWISLSVGDAATSGHPQLPGGRRGDILPSSPQSSRGQLVSRRGGRGGCGTRGLCHGYPAHGGVSLRAHLASPPTPPQTSPERHPLRRWPLCSLVACRENRASKRPNSEGWPDCCGGEGATSFDDPLAVGQWGRKGPGETQGANRTSSAGFPRLPPLWGTAAQGRCLPLPLGWPIWERAEGTMCLAAVIPGGTLGGCSVAGRERSVGQEPVPTANPSGQWSEHHCGPLTARSASPKGRFHRAPAVPIAARSGILRVASPSLRTSMLVPSIRCILTGWRAPEVRRPARYRDCS